LLAAVGEHPSAEFYDKPNGSFDGFAMHPWKLEENLLVENAKMALFDVPPSDRPVDDHIEPRANTDLNGIPNQAD
jgi:hypothetical protein